eukprot:TRINITY_DN3838_c0_g2_i1.p1 TRINITY_DN3838_c0_g2~~TRINITY_DN3838_c0_g2_i1.p1  ORF type:complete len:113 (-),score=14.96 TRINITY_DN3838_c0_g2_i1:265-603(-)
MKRGLNEVVCSLSVIWMVHEMVGGTDRARRKEEEEGKKTRRTSQEMKVKSWLLKIDHHFRGVVSHEAFLNGQHHTKSKVYPTKGLQNEKRELSSSLGLKKKEGNEVGRNRTC